MHMETRLTSAGLAEEGCVGADLDDLVAGDGTGHDDDLGGVAGDCALELGESRDSDSSGRASTGGARIKVQYYTYNRI